jgi:hypothetical protein
MDEIPSGFKDDPHLVQCFPTIPKGLPDGIPLGFTGRRLGLVGNDKGLKAGFSPRSAKVETRVAERRLKTRAHPPFNRRFATPLHFSASGAASL